MVVIGSDLGAAEFSLNCKWTSGDGGREQTIDRVIIDVGNQRIDLLMTRERGDGWTYSNTKTGSFGNNTVDIRRDDGGVITVSATRAMGPTLFIPVIISLNERSGRLTYVDSSGEFIRRNDYVCSASAR